MRRKGCNMQRRWIFEIFLFVSTVQAASAQSERELLERLPEPVRVWLEEEVNYIIAEEEREVFLRLESDVERASFIQVFWRRRDTNPATLENEYQIEHYKRLSYANKFLGRDTSRPGWQTDRGRYHILLGSPRDVANFEHEDSVYPTELWSYNHSELKKYGLPPFFYLLFFRRHGAGVFELYNPVIDGPQSLLTGVNEVTQDYRGDLERTQNKLWEIHPELAHASISFRTDEGNVVARSTSFGTLSLLDDVRNVPFRGIDTSYASRLDFERGYIESDFLFRYVPSFGMMRMLPGPEGANYLHWTIELNPEHIAVVNDPDSNLAGSMFITSIEITPKDDPNKVLLQLRKESFMQMPTAQVDQGARRPYSYSGMTPVAPGSYNVRVIFRNRACPSRIESECYKSYTIQEATLAVPDASNTTPRLSEIVLAYGTEAPDGKSLYRPFRFGTTQLLPNPKRVYAIGDSVVYVADAIHPPSSSTIRSRVVHQLAPDEVLIERSASVVETRLEMPVQEISLEGLEGGRYRLVVDLLGPDREVLDTKSEDFDVTPRTGVARPFLRGSWPQVLPEVPGLAQMALGEQYASLENEEEARRHFEAALAQNPNLGPVRERLAFSSLEEGDSGRAIELLEPVYAEVQNRYEVVAVLGEAYFREENYEKASELLGRAITLHRPTTQLLNFLAVSQHQLGDPQSARESLKRSLEIDADQPEIQELLRKLESEPAAPPQ